MKTLLLALSLFCLLCSAQAQTNSIIHVKGTVVDSASRKPLSFATLVLQNSKTMVPEKTSCQVTMGVLTCLSQTVQTGCWFLPLPGMIIKPFPSPTDNPRIWVWYLCICPENN